MLRFSVDQIETMGNINLVYQDKDDGKFDTYSRLRCVRDDAPQCFLCCAVYLFRVRFYNFISISIIMILILFSNESEALFQKLNRFFGLPPMFTNVWV